MYSFLEERNGQVKYKPCLEEDESNNNKNIYITVPMKTTLMELISERFDFASFVAKIAFSKDLIS